MWGRYSSRKCDGGVRRKKKFSFFEILIVQLPSLEDSGRLFGIGEGTEGKYRGLFFLYYHFCNCFCLYSLSVPLGSMKRNARSPLAAVSTGTLATSTGLKLRLVASHLLSLEQHFMCNIYHLRSWLLWK